MEKKISGSSAIRLNSALAGGLAALLLAFSVPSHATGLVAGATEFTQIANNIELIMQVSEATQTTANTLMTAQSTMQMLRQLPSSAIDGAMGGLPVDKVRAMADAYQVMSKATSVYKDAADVLKKAESDAKQLGITPSELLRHKANAAAMHGGIYKQTYEQEQAKLARLAKTSAEVQKQANTVQSIDSNVGGIQLLASQNVQVQASLADIATSIATANANAALEAEKAKKAKSDDLNRSALADDEFRRNQQKAKESRDKISTDGLIPR